MLGQGFLIDSGAVAEVPLLPDIAHVAAPLEAGLAASPPVAHDQHLAMMP